MSGQANKWGASLPAKLFTEVFSRSFQWASSGNVPTDEKKNLSNKFNSIQLLLLQSMRDNSYKSKGVLAHFGTLIKNSWCLYFPVFMWTELEERVDVGGTTTIEDIDFTYHKGARTISLH